MKYLPNALTILRIVLTPVFIILAFFIQTASALHWALIIFIIAAISDWLDGAIARKYNVISNFGKIWDPLADKFIVLSALAALVWKAPFNLHWLIFAIVCLREVVVTIMREIYAKKQIIIPADKWGKLKTILQMVGIVVCLALWAFNFTPQVAVTGSQIWFWLVALITLLSGVNYLRVKHT